MSLARQVAEARCPQQLQLQLHSTSPAFKTLAAARCRARARKFNTSENYNVILEFMI
jgi:hypothetical protein